MEVGAGIRGSQWRGWSIGRSRCPAGNGRSLAVEDRKIADRGTLIQAVGGRRWALGVIATSPIRPFAHSPVRPFACLLLLLTRFSARIRDLCDLPTVRGLYQQE